MTVFTTHEDTHGDAIMIYRKSGEIYLDGVFDAPDSPPAWRGIYTPEGAREIAKRLNDLADIMEGK